MEVKLSVQDALKLQKTQQEQKLSEIKSSTILPKVKLTRSASHQKLQAMTKNTATSLPILTIKKDNYLKKNRKTVARIHKP